MVTSLNWQSRYLSDNQPMGLSDGSLSIILSDFEKFKRPFHCPSGWETFFPLFGRHFVELKIGKPVQFVGSSSDESKDSVPTSSQSRTTDTNRRLRLTGTRQVRSTVVDRKVYRLFLSKYQCWKFKWNMSLVCEVIILCEGQRTSQKDLITYQPRQIHAAFLIYLCWLIFTFERKSALQYINVRTYLQM